MDFNSRMIGDLLKQLFPALGKFIAHHFRRPFDRSHESGKLWLPEHGVADPHKFTKFSVPVFWHTSDFQNASSS